MTLTHLPRWIRTVHLLAPGTGTHCIRSRYEKLSESDARKDARITELTRQNEALTERLAKARLSLHDEQNVNMRLRKELHGALECNRQNAMHISGASSPDTGEVTPSAESDSERTLTQTELKKLSPEGIKELTAHTHVRHLSEAPRITSIPQQKTSPQ